MAKKAKRKVAAKKPRARKLAIKKESVRERSAPETRATRGAIVISTKAMRGMVIDRAAAALFKRGR